ncbi:hypothetical protein PSTG_17931, partial [Puccinia striiformis f. sp. tritici PST-78]
MPMAGFGGGPMGSFGGRAMGSFWVTLYLANLFIRWEQEGGGDVRYAAKLVVGAFIPSSKANFKGLIERWSNGTTVANYYSLINVGWLVGGEISGDAGPRKLISRLQFPASIIFAKLAEYLHRFAFLELYE